MIISKVHLLTKLIVFAPRYKDQYGKLGEPVALLHQKKVDFASPVILVEFKAKHLLGQRFCIKKAEAQKHVIGSNGVAPMYEIPMSHFDSWESAQEVLDLTKILFEE